MTLTTKVMVHEQTDPAALHAWVNEHLLGKADAATVVKPTSIANRAGQGLDALFDSQWSEGGGSFDWATDWYFDRDDYDTDAEYRAALASEPQGWLLLSFDTPYGCSPTETHARLIVGLHDGYLKPNGLTFAWNDEFRDEWHEGLTGFDNWFEASDNAMQWFRNVAQPAIAAHVTRVSTKGGAR